MKYSDKFLLSITGRNDKDLKKKILELEKLGIQRVALFVEFLKRNERKKVYEALLSSSIKEIPFCHARTDMTKEEYDFLIKNFKTKYFNLHGIRFNKQMLKRVDGLHKKILIELAYHNNTHVSQIDLKKLGGFCIDLSHFKASEDRWTNEFEFIFNRRNVKHYFIANHLNGYSPSRKKDLHTVRSLKDFEYLKTLPKFLFGKYIALEVMNSIKEQIKFRKHIMKILRSKLR